MGQKMDPHGLRVGIIKDWDSKWYANKKDFADNLVEDYKIREFVKEKLYIAEEMIGHKLGEFAPTRTFKGHAGDKTSKVNK